MGDLDILPIFIIYNNNYLGGKTEFNLAKHLVRTMVLLLIPCMSQLVIKDRTCLDVVT